jgi:hypothetical protein
MLTERSKVPSEPKKRDFFPAKNPIDARREVVPGTVTFLPSAEHVEFKLNVQRNSMYRKIGPS